jgi:hypothetical protein
VSKDLFLVTGRYSIMSQVIAAIGEMTLSLKAPSYEDVLDMDSRVRKLSDLGWKGETPASAPLPVICTSVLIPPLTETDPGCTSAYLPSPSILCACNSSKQRRLVGFRILLLCACSATQCTTNIVMGPHRCQSIARNVCTIQLGLEYSSHSYSIFF